MPITTGFTPWLPSQPHSRYSLTHICAPKRGVACAKSPQGVSVDYTIALSKFKIEDKNQPLSPGWRDIEGVKKETGRNLEEKKKRSLSFKAK